uniref:Uncharacterized protein n=1 Tax=Meloidogyne enterolobii TaxID=390850 RepID=A0A6V7UTD0_MELEN|nr:unnamed protein product [Meloidogyne enterolobii]
MSININIIYRQNFSQKNFFRHCIYRFSFKQISKKSSHFLYKICFISNFSVINFFGIFYRQT